MFSLTFENGYPIFSERDAVATRAGTTSGTTRVAARSQLTAEIDFKVAHLGAPKFLHTRS